MGIDNVQKQARFRGHVFGMPGHAHFPQCMRHIIFDAKERDIADGLRSGCRHHQAATKSGTDQTQRGVGLGGLLRHTRHGAHGFEQVQCFIFN